MTKTSSPSSSERVSPPHVSPLNQVMTFFEVVFNGNDHETKERKAEIMAILDRSFAEGYTFNGQPMKPSDLFTWRESFWKRFTEMTFRVESALSGPVDAGPRQEPTKPKPTSTVKPTAAVCVSWIAMAQEQYTGNMLRLRAMNMLEVSEGVAVSNTQIGDAENGWQLVD